jgi:hypothetical protein
VSEAGDSGVHLASPGRHHNGHRAVLRAGRASVLAPTAGATPVVAPPDPSQTRPPMQPPYRIVPLARRHLKYNGIYIYIYEPEPQLGSPSPPRSTASVSQARSFFFSLSSPTRSAVTSHQSVLGWDGTRRMARHRDDGVDLTELTLGPPGISARKARRARTNGHASSTCVTQSDPVSIQEKDFLRSHY